MNYPLAASDLNSMTRTKRDLGWGKGRTMFL